MILAGDLLDAVGINQIIIVFAYTTVSIEVKPWMEFTSYKAKSLLITYPGRRLVVSTVELLGKVIIFYV